MTAIRSPFFLEEKGFWSSGGGKRNSVGIKKKRRRGAPQENNEGAKILCGVTRRMQTSLFHRKRYQMGKSRKRIVGKSCWGQARIIWGTRIAGVRGKGEWILKNDTNGGGPDRIGKHNGGGERKRGREDGFRRLASGF